MTSVALSPLEATRHCDADILLTGDHLGFSFHRLFGVSASSSAIKNAQDKCVFKYQCKLSFKLRKWNGSNADSSDIKMKLRDMICPIIRV